MLKKHSAADVVIDVGATNAFAQVRRGEELSHETFSGGNFRHRSESEMVRLIKNIDDNGKKESPPNTAANFPRPEHLRANHIAEHHSKVCPPIYPKNPVVKRKLFINIPGIPGDKQFGQVCHADNCTGQYNYLVHGFNMVDGHIFF